MSVWGVPVSVGVGGFGECRCEWYRCVSACEWYGCVSACECRCECRLTVRGNNTRIVSVGYRCVSVSVGVEGVRVRVVVRGMGEYQCGVKCECR